MQSKDGKPIFQPNKQRDIAEKKYGKLLALNFEYRDNSHNHFWKFRCDCGNEIIARKNAVTSGNTTQCKECSIKARARKISTHGYARTRLYKEWAGIIQRCENPKSTSYNRYGALGITVCDEWHEFENFANWSINNGYSDDLTIDRIDVDGNYEPLNCRWADKDTQENNKRSNVSITYNGETMNISQWAKKLGLPVNILLNRRRLGWNNEKILSEPYHKGRKGYGCVNYEYNGEAHSLTEWAELYGIKFNCLYSRWKKGKRGAELFKGYGILQQIKE